MGQYYNLSYIQNNATSILEVAQGANLIIDGYLIYFIIFGIQIATFLFLINRQEMNVALLGTTIIGVILSIGFGLLGLTGWGLTISNVLLSAVMIGFILASKSDN